MPQLGPLDRVTSKEAAPLYGVMGRFDLRRGLTTQKDRVEKKFNKNQILLFHVL